MEDFQNFVFGFFMLLIAPFTYLWRTLVAVFSGKEIENDQFAGASIEKFLMVFVMMFVGAGIILLGIIDLVGEFVG